MKHAMVILFTAAAVAAALTALPILGYSSSTGLLIGGYLIHPPSGWPPGSAVSLDAYYGTAGIIKFNPSVMVTLPGGVLTCSLESRKVLSEKWFGWGNDTDPDSSLEMDHEIHNLTAEYLFPLSGNLIATTGVDARFSTVFNRESGPLWSTVPGDVFGETFSAGLTARLTAVYPAPLYGDFLLETSGFFQEGDVSYAGITGRARLQARPWEGGEITLGTRLHRQFGVADTPLPYTSGIGANSNFRGYSDNRFTGTWWTVSQLEVRQRILQLPGEDGEPGVSLGLAAFAETGRTAEAFTELGEGPYHSDIGGGIRIGVSPQAKMRLDAGWGDEGMVISAGFDSAI